MSTYTASAEAYRLPRQGGERIRLPRHPLSPDPNDREAVRSWLKSQPRPWAIDLFSGAGGLSLRLEEPGFSVVAAADSDLVAMETHAGNIRGLTWVGDLTNPDDVLSQLKEWGIDRVDLPVGGTTCQPFAGAGMAKIGYLVRVGVRQSHDEKADLWTSFFTVMDCLKPRVSSLREHYGPHPRAGRSIADSPRDCPEGSWIRSQHRWIGRLGEWPTPAPVMPFLRGHPNGRGFRMAIRKFTSHTAIGHQRPSNRRVWYYSAKVRPYLGLPECELGQKLHEGLPDHREFVSSVVGIETPVAAIMKLTRK